jgi:predicted aspartyl protease
MSECPNTEDGGSQLCDLHSLCRARRWFDLRDAVGKVSSPSFYLGAVACAFNQFPQCTDYLTRVSDSAPHSQQAYDAHEVLMWACLRRGSFHCALTHLDSLLSIKPNGAGLRALGALLWALSQSPGQSIERLHSCRLRWKMVEGNMFIPVAINGRLGHFMLDSGATISLITQSEAKRLDLRLQEIGPDAAKLYGATGAEIGFHVAVAARLSVGNAHLSNVNFLVLKDENLQFPAGYGGALGLPVLIGLQTMSWNKDGQLDLCFPSPQPVEIGNANVCFDGPEPVTEVVFRQQRLPLVLDTGSGMTVLSHEFARAFDKVLNVSGRKSSILVSGVSGSAQVPSVCLPRVEVWVAGFEAVLRPAHVLLK